MKKSVPTFRRIKKALPILGLMLFSGNMLFAQDAIIAQWLVDGASTANTWISKSVDSQDYFYQKCTAPTSGANSSAEMTVVEPVGSVIIKTRDNKIGVLADASVSASFLEGDKFKYGFMFVNNFDPQDYFTTTISTIGRSSLNVTTFLTGGGVGQFKLQYQLPGGVPIEIATYDVAAKNKAYQFSTLLPSVCEGVGELELRWVSTCTGVYSPGIAVSINGQSTATNILDSNKELDLIYMRDSYLIVVSKDYKTMPLYSIAGQIVKNLSLKAGENVIEMNSMPRGIYIIGKQKIVY